MASKGTTGAPTTVEEGLGNVAQAIVATMSAPDAQPHLDILQKLLTATIAMQHQSKGAAAPGGAPAPGAAAAPPNPMAGGTPPQAPPSASPSGISGETIRRMVGANA